MNQVITELCAVQAAGSGGKGVKMKRGRIEIQPRF